MSNTSLTQQQFLQNMFEEEKQAAERRAKILELFVASASALAPALAPAPAPAPASKLNAPARTSENNVPSCDEQSAPAPAPAPAPARAPALASKLNAPAPAPARASALASKLNAPAHTSEKYVPSGSDEQSDLPRTPPVVAESGASNAIGFSPDSDDENTENDGAIAKADSAENTYSAVVKEGRSKVLEKLLTLASARAPAPARARAPAPAPACVPAFEQFVPKVLKTQVKSAEERKKVEARIVDAMRRIKAHGTTLETAQNELSTAKSLLQRTTPNRKVTDLMNTLDQRVRSDSKSIADTEKELKDLTASLLPPGDKLSREDANLFENLKSGSTPKTAELVNAIQMVFDHLLASEESIKSVSNQKKGPSTATLTVYKNDEVLPHGLKECEVIRFLQVKSFFQIMNVLRKQHSNFTDMFYISYNKDNGRYYVKVQTNLGTEGKLLSPEDNVRWILHFFTAVNHHLSKTRVEQSLEEVLSCNELTSRLLSHHPRQRKIRDSFAGVVVEGEEDDEGEEDKDDSLSFRSSAKSSVVKSSGGGGALLTSPKQPEQDSKHLVSSQSEKPIKELLQKYRSEMRRKFGRTSVKKTTLGCESQIPPEAFKAYQAIKNHSTRVDGKSVSDFLLENGIIREDDDRGTFTIMSE